MPPKVEVLQPLETPEGDFRYFEIDLLAESTSFDMALFDEQLQELATNRFLLIGFGSVKFVVINNRLSIFPTSIQHAYFSRLLGGEEVAPQSAGFISFNFRRKPVSVDSNILLPGERRLYGDSRGLHKHKVLSPADSDQYKHSVLASLLGEYFTVA